MRLTLCVLGLALSSPAAAVAAEFPKIVGGNEVTPFSKPYVGALTGRDADFHFCGAILISNTAAVTAAHCVLFGAKVDVWFARHNETLAAVDEGAVRRQVERVHVHPRYQPYTNEYDFALLLWAAPVRVKPVRVFFGPREQITGLYSTSAGWGATAESGPQSDVLRAVSGMELWTQDRCSDALKYNVSESMVCAARPDETRARATAAGRCSWTTRTCWWAVCRGASAARAKVCLACTASWPRLKTGFASSSTCRTRGRKTVRTVRPS